MIPTYTGITNDVNRRFNEHQIGIHPESYTFSRRPLELMFYEESTDPSIAIEYEKKIKKWSRAKKEALINEQCEKFPMLSKKSLKNNYFK